MNSQKFVSRKSRADESDNWRRPAVIPQVDQEQEYQPLQQPPKYRKQHWPRYGHSNSKPKISMDDVVPRIRRVKTKKPPAIENGGAASQAEITSSDQPVAITPDKSEIPVSRKIKETWSHFVKEHDQDRASSTDEEWITSTTAEPKKPKFKTRSLAPYLHPWDRNSYNKRTFFQPFINPTDVEFGLEEGTLYQGIVRLTKNPFDAYVKSDDLDFDIYIGGTSDRNRALDGDLVAVQLKDIDEVWELRKERQRKRKEAHLERLNEMNKDQEQEPEQEMLVKSGEMEEGARDEESDKDEDKPVYCGNVISIMERATNVNYTGQIYLEKPGIPEAFKNNYENKQAGPLIAWFKPTDRRIPFFILRGKDIPRELADNEEYFKTHIFSASIIRWQITDRYPTGRIEKEIGPIGDLDAERQAIIANNNIIDHAFTPVALRCLPETPWSIPEKEYKARRDLRNERVFSIDPRTAKDLDDALHVKELDDGFFEVGVHIADVTYFLKRNTPLDSEARTRGTSTYLVDSVIPMLPPLLCEELCSLNPGVERLAFSVIWKMDKKGKPVETWFGKTIIKSCAKLAYEDAQRVIEGDNLPDDVDIFGNNDDFAIANDILTLYRLSVSMRKGRYDGGSLSMNSVKLQFVLDDKGDPVSFSQFEAKDANRLIEEFMLLANISVAHRIAKAFPDEALLRRHEDPLSKRLNEFIRITEVLGLDFDGHSAGSLQSSFNKINNQDVKDVLLILAIRTMQRAKYFCSGSIDISKFHHYALNEDFYTHFTSPIRRYADVIVHRVLETALVNEDKTSRALPSPYNKKMLQKIAFECNSKKNGAKNAQDNDIMVYLSRYLTRMEELDGPVYTKADVIVVAKETYDVYIPEYGLEKRIHLKDLPVSHFNFDKNKLSLDIFWKRGIPVTMHNEEKIYSERANKDEYSDGEDREEEEEEEEKETLDSLARLTLKEPVRDKVVDAGELIPPVVLDQASCMQTISMFSQIDVRLQINNLVSPPIINIYPVNPFSGEEDERNN